jgi:murein DD-endopeptidase MepM/ murein hydrolase activator NlpD
MAAPDLYPVTLAITETVSGDRLSVQEMVSVTTGSFERYNIVIPDDRTNLLDPELSAQERVKVGAAFSGVTHGQWWTGVFTYPLKSEIRITARFGQRRSYNGGPVSSYHSGQDLGADEGVPVVAPAEGKVVLAEQLQVRGQAIIIDHGWGVFTGFWHLSRIDVEPGQMVEAGQFVGLVGNTGLSTGPHLHWEMQVGSVPVDPLQWIQQVFP